MVTKREIFEDLGFNSDRISSQVRAIGIGLLVITWGLLIGQFPGIELTSCLKKNLMGIGAVAIAIMFLDFLQYVCGYWNADALRKQMEKEGKSEIEYDYGTRLYKLRGSLFWIKQLLLAAGVVWFFIILFVYFF